MEIIINSKLEQKDYLKAVLKKPLFLIFPVTGFFMILLYVSYFIGDYSYGNPPVFQLILGLFFMIGFPSLLYYQIKKNFNSNKQVQEDIKYTFTPDIILVNGETFNSEMSWEKVYKVKESKDLIFIYQSRQIAYFIPKRYFSGQQLQDFKQMVNRMSGIKIKFKA